ncbi:hypothetical protein CTEN210_08938 [Chaetoceros tenuissimus]|uniref:alpha-1,6-mannosyl-glycoprotein 6-beta-N-acetylglucosaminyltransferase n=1 Tax=Chaetoceros tenuissimus TaxID=426638 RepID=A0AAD3CUU1_9STRA|nr:hypothetical protein CTEN210_08938 [Chaetoceros tenuissimus]
MDSNSLLPKKGREPSLRALRGKTIIVEDSNNFTCAPQIPKEKRKVLYINAIGIEKYATNLEQKYMSGEYYAMASWEHAIRQNGFLVDEVTFEEVLEIPETLLHEYHRIVLGCAYKDWKTKCSLHNDEEYLIKLSQKLRPIKAKVGSFYWWDHEEDEVPGYLGDDFFTPKQVLTPFDWQKSNTFLGFFPHFHITQNSTNDATEDTLPLKKERIGLVLSKDGDFFDEQALRVIDSLVQHNFTIHTTCKLHNCSMFLKRKGVVNHKKLTPTMYVKLMEESAFMLGIGNPIISPSPIIAMAKGVPFLNPKRFEDMYQHPPLVKVGEPYVYNIEDFDNIADIIDKAEKAVENPIKLFVPSDFDKANVIERTCRMLQRETFI